MALHLTSDHLQQVKTHAESTYPEECCGLLLGEWDRETGLKQLREVRSTENAWSQAVAEEMAAIAAAPKGLTKAHWYWIDPQEMFAVQRYARDRHLDIVGIYHSHPDHPAVPSESDRACAWSQYSYMIISVQQGVAQDLLCWSLDHHHQFQPETMITVASVAS